MGNKVSFRIQIDDSGTFKTVTADADELGRAIDGVKRQAKELNNDLVNWAATTQLIEGLESTFGSLKDVLGGLADEYGRQQEVYTKLSIAMSNTMGATEEEARSIEALCDEYEKYGVVAADAQMAGAQELATYLELSDSLKAIIPVMNDMAAQQYGVGASAESVTQIATMLGKVMNGQTEALSRYGYKFNEAQKEILLYGDEAERAAVLVDVVTESVGGMNEALGRTDAGKLVQLENRLGKVKEALGSVVSGIMPFLNAMSSLVISAAGVYKLVGVFKALSASVIGAKVAGMANAAAMKLQSAAAKILGISTMEAKVATGALKAEIIATEAAITMGLSLAVSGLIELLSRLISNGNGASESLDTMSASQDAFQSTAKNTRLELAAETVELESLIKKKQQTAEKVEYLNNTYGKAFGYHSTAAEWYEVLKNKSAAYSRQLGYEAQAIELSVQAEEKKARLEEILSEMRDMRAKGTDKGISFAPGGSRESAKYKDLKKQGQQLQEELNNLNEEYQDVMAKATAASDELTASDTSGAEAVNWRKMNLESLTKAIQLQEGKVRGLAGANEAEAKAEAEVLKQMKARKDLIESTYGLSSSSDNEANAGSKKKKKVDLTPVTEDIEVLRALEAETAECQSTADLAVNAMMIHWGVLPSVIDKSILEIERLGESAGGSIPELQDMLDSMLDDIDSNLSKSMNTDGMDGTVSVIDSMAAAMSALGSVTSEAAGSWLSWGANLLRAVAQAIPAITTLLGLQATETSVAIGSTVAKGASSVAGVPIVGPGLAIAAAATLAATLISTIASIPKFASGGLAYGPTLGLFGEYAGASHNPEVVAPLNNLRAIIADSVGFGEGKVKFEIEGGKLVGVLNRYYSIRNRG